MSIPQIKSKTIRKSLKLPATHSHLPFKLRTSDVLCSDIALKRIPKRSSVMNRSNVQYNEEEIDSWTSWIGHRVSIGGVKFGVLRYFGETEFSSGLWCGVELDEPVGKNNGVVKGVQYFTCRERYGIFAPLAKTSKVPEKSNISLPGKPSRSKLPSPKVQRIQSYASSDLDRTFTLINPNDKTFLPACMNISSSNNNNNNNNTANLNETFLKTQTEIAEELSLNLSATLNNLPSCNRSAKMPSDPHSPVPIINDVHQRRTEYHNQMITHNHNYNKNIYQRVPEFNTFSLSDDLEHNSQESLTLELSEKSDASFILGKHSFPSELKACEQESCDSKEKLLSVDLDESLGILSPSEMKDFTMCFENTVSVSERPLGIPKIESCDDVSDLPEWEVMTPDKGVILSAQDTESTLIGSTLNSTVQMEGERTFNTSTATNSVTHKSTLFQTQRDVAAEICHKSSDQAIEEAFDLQPDNSMKATKSVCQPLHEMEALEYVPFNSNKSLNSSFDISNKPLGPLSVGSNSDILVNSNTVNTNSQIKSVKVSETFNLNETVVIKPGSTVSKVASDRYSFSPIDCESLPNVICNKSSLDQDHIESLSFLGNSPSPVISSVLNKNLIDFSLDSPLLKNISSNIDNAPKALEDIDEVFHCSPQVELSTKPHSSPKKEEAELVDLCEVAVANDEVQHSEEKCCKAFMNTFDNVNISPNLVNIPADSNESGAERSRNNIYAGPSTEVVSTIALPCDDNIETTQSLINTSDVMISNSTFTKSDSVETNVLNKTRNVSSALSDMELFIPAGVSVQVENASITSDKFNAVVKPTVLHTSLCSESAVDSQLDTVVHDVENYDGKLMQTFSCEKLESLLTQAVPGASFDNDDKNEVQQGAGSVKGDFAGQSFTIESPGVSPSLHEKIADVSIISGDGTCFEISDLFDADEMNSSPADVHNATYHVSRAPETENKTSSSAAARRCLMSTTVTKATGSKRAASAENFKPVKRITSKVKTMIETKETPSTNQENINIKSSSSQKKPGKWDAITSKISAGLSKKTPEKDIVCKINTNLNLTRHSTPKVPGCSSLKPEKINFRNSGIKTLKNALSYRTVDEKFSDFGSKGSKILTQLQNVSTSSKSSDGSKIPLYPLNKSGGSQLPSPCSASSASSVPSISKSGTTLKRSIPSKAPNEYSNLKTNLKVPASNPASSKSRMSLGKFKEPLAKDWLVQKKRFSLLPKPSRP